MDARHTVLGTARLAVAALGVVAMTYQFASLVTGTPGFVEGNFFSFFTIQSNILAAVALAAAAIVPPAERSGRFDSLRGAITLYIAITGVVFAVLLSGLQESLDTHIGWVNFVVHTLVPIAVVGDWLVDPPRHVLPLATAGGWLAYPAAWLVYTLVRGSRVDWYPYPFVDVGTHGYGRVLVNCAALTLFFAAAALAFVWLGNRRCRR